MNSSVLLGLQRDDLYRPSQVKPSQLFFLPLCCLTKYLRNVVQLIETVHLVQLLSPLLSLLVSIVKCWGFYKVFLAQCFVWAVWSITSQQTLQMPVERLLTGLVSSQPCTRQWEVYILSPEKPDTNKLSSFLVYMFISLCDCDRQDAECPHS